MKNILVPTDFSDCAGYALDAGLSLAGQFGANVYVLTRPELPSNWDSLDKKQREENQDAQQAILRVGALLEDLKKQHAGASLRTSWVTGKLPESIGDFVSRNQIDLVVMGSHGASGKNEYFIGSNTQKVVRTVHCPVLVVKEPLKKAGFEKVVFASNFEEEELPAFRRFVDFIKKFNSEIHLVAIHASPFDATFPELKEAMKPFQAAGASLACKTHVYKDISIDEGIRSFASEIGADLIAISNRQRHPIKRIFIGSNVEALVNHSNLPVLTIDFD